MPARGDSARRLATQVVGRVHLDHEALTAHDDVDRRPRLVLVPAIGPERVGAGLQLHRVGEEDVPGPEPLGGPGVEEALGPEPDLPGQSRGEGPGEDEPRPGEHAEAPLR